MLIYSLISYNIVCNTNTTTKANEIKALTRVESDIAGDFLFLLSMYGHNLIYVHCTSIVYLTNTSL